ncbi:hypothetical protein [Spirillospora sp. NPDC029432]|uniref:hypothetical protein n=1 Tax=Spirillospora sp. NPDC029432 TaxID=3154599 RepID=UPI0034511837
MDAADHWRRHALLWKSQFPTEAWQNLITVVEVSRIARGDLELRPFPPYTGANINLTWTFTTPFPRHFSGTAGYDIDLPLEGAFLCDASTDLLLHAVQPIPNASWAVVDLRTSDGDTESLAEFTLRIVFPDGAMPRDASLIEDLQRILDKVGNGRMSHELVQRVLDFYQDRARSETPLCATILIKRIVELPETTPEQYLQAACCLLEEWAICRGDSTFLEHFDQVIERCLDALHRNGAHGHLIELWVRVAEFCLPEHWVPLGFTQLELTIAELYEQVRPPRVRPERFRRALRPREPDDAA